MLGFTRTLVFSTAPDKGPAHTTSTCAWWDCRLFFLSQGNHPYFLQQRYPPSVLSFFFVMIIYKIPALASRGFLGLIVMETERRRTLILHCPHALGLRRRTARQRKKAESKRQKEGKRRGPGCRQLESTGSGIPNRPRFKSWHHTLPAMWP